MKTIRIEFLIYYNKRRFFRSKSVIDRDKIGVIHHNHSFDAIFTGFHL